METVYKYPKCTDCVHAHMNKNGNHDCGFMDCVSEQDKEYPDETTFESYLSCYDCLQKYVSAERRIAELEAQVEQLQKINSEQKETLKKVRVALIKERTANIMNYGKGGVEMFDSLFEILKGVSN